MMNSSKFMDIVRQITNVLFGFGQVLVSYFSVLTGIGVGIGERWQGGFNAAQPATYAFAIWGLVFPACMAYAVYQALPAQREKPLLRRIGWLTGLAFFFTCVWEIAAQLQVDSWPLGVLLFGIWWLLVPPYLAIARNFASMSTAERLLVAFPINILTGWVSVAVFAGFGAAFVASGIENIYIFSGLVLLAGLIGTTFTLLGRGNFAYPFAVLWGLVGVVVANYPEGRYMLVTVTAASMIALVLIAYVIAWIKSRKVEPSPEQNAS